MTISAQIEAFESLAALDSTIRDLEEELEAQGHALAGKKETLQELESKLAKAVASVEDMDRVRSELMQEARQMSVQLERSREKLSRCRTEREVNAAQREIEELRKLYRDREIEIEKLAQLAEQARTDMEATENAREVLLGELGASEGDVTTRLDDIRSEVAAKRSEREQFIKVIPTTLFRRYELIRKRKGSALASTTDGTCSACHMTLPPMLFQQLMRRAGFDQCNSCNRIIYFRVASEEESAASDGHGGSEGPEGETAQSSGAQNRSTQNQSTTGGA